MWPMQAPLVLARESIDDPISANCVLGMQNTCEHILVLSCHGLLDVPIILAV